MICFPNAKINLGLYVTKKRMDGMHNIHTCYIPIPLYDILEVQHSDKFSILNYGIPINNNQGNNIIDKVWRLISSIKKDIKPVKVCLYKNIPIGAGLGGGSSDATFFLKAINTIASLSLTPQQLVDIATKIGADCTFFINNKSAIASGTGNILSIIPNPIINTHLTIIFPHFGISTKNAFSKIVPGNRKNLQTILANNKLWKYNLINDFENIAIGNYPELQTIKNTLYDLGAHYASLSGSGSAIYALSEKPLNTEVFKDAYWVWSQTLLLK